MNQMMSGNILLMTKKLYGIEQKVRDVIFIIIMLLSSDKHLGAKEKLSKFVNKLIFQFILSNILIH